MDLGRQKMSTQKMEVWPSIVFVQFEFGNITTPFYYPISPVCLDDTEQ